MAKFDEKLNIDPVNRTLLESFLFWEHFLTFLFLFLFYILLINYWHYEVDWFFNYEDERFLNKLFIPIPEPELLFMDMILV